jgi:hypothetical protein
MASQNTVELFLIIVSLLFVAFEVHLNLNDAPNDTTNVTLLELSKKRLIFIPYAIGVIAGHLFLGTYWFSIPSKYEVWVLVGFAFICLILYIIAPKIKTRSTLFFSILLAIGLLSGHFLWSMNSK